MSLRGLIGQFGGLALPLLHRFDAETAHGMTIAALRAMPPMQPEPNDKALAVEAFGLRFPNPLGMAAGFDKNAEVPDALLGLGFGFVEIGTLTPLPQAGNPKPRMFRLPADAGVINRLGFNNEGHQAGLQRLKARAGRPGIVGVNIGANKDTQDRAADYVKGITAFAGVASYFTVNVSSPNTPGLRDLQHEAALDDLLARVMEARDAAPVRRPVLLKIAPDLTRGDLDGVVGVARRRGLDGLIVSNTTISRPSSLRDPAKSETGGLSGKPLFPLATRMLAEAYTRVEGAFPIIGVGGIHSPETALAKIEAGATLIQVYSGFVFRGPSLAGDIKSGLLGAMRREKLVGLQPLVGRRASALCSEPLPAGLT